MKASQRGTQLLLNALEALGYVKQRNGRYTNTPMTVKWMVRSSPTYIASAFPFFNGVIEHWGYLDEAIRKGETPLTGWEWFDRQPDGWQNYNAAMMATARMADPEIIAKVKLQPSARRLLDVGGGHGLHAINFCLHYSDLTATILDWPQTRKTAEANITAAVSRLIEPAAGRLYTPRTRDHQQGLLLLPGRTIGRPEFPVLVPNFSHPDDELPDTDGRQ